METRILKFDGRFAPVFTWRTLSNTVAETVWRFVMDGNRALVVVPCQSSKAPARSLHSVPERIESVLGGRRGLGDFGWAVEAAARGHVGEAEPNWEQEIEESTKQELSEWRGKQSFPHLDQWEREREEIHEKYGSDVSDKDLAPLHEPKRFKQVEAEREKIRTKEEEIESNHRRRLEKEKHARIKEEQILAEMKRTLRGYGVKSCGKDALCALIHFIREDLFHGRSKRATIRDAHLRQVLVKLQGLTGKDITERVVLSYAPNMRSIVDQWVSKVSEAEGISQEEARGLFFDRARFMAVWPDQTFCPICSLLDCIHDMDESIFFQKVAPDAAKRAELEELVRRAEETTNARLELPYVNKAGERRPNGEFLVKRGVIEKLMAGPGGTKPYIVRDILKDPNKQFKRGHWEGNPSAALYDIRNEGFSLEDLRKMKKKRAVPG